MRDPALPVRRWILALVLLSYLTTAFYATHYGFAAFLWDNSEYVANALDTADHTAAVGLPSWLAYIVAGQHYGKPPLYVNSLAAFIHLVGRSRLLLAVGLLAAVSSALLGIAVFFLVRRVASFWLAILSMLAVAGLPSVARWAPDAYPDVQLALCVVWVIAMLAGEPKYLWLGFALGAGLLAKSTFPFYVALPLAYWWWLGKQDRPARLRTIAKAAILGGAIAAVWYAGNLREALSYAQTAYGGSYSAQHVFIDNIAAWLRVTAFQGIGIITLALAAIAALIFLLPRKPDAPRFPRERVMLLLLGGMPVLLVAFTSPLADNRRTLPAFVLLALALLLTMFWIAKISRIGELLMGLILVGVLGQWTLTKLAEIPWSAEQLQASPTGQKLFWLEPAVLELQGASTEAVEAVIDRAQALGPAAPSRWFVSGNDGYFNVPRLQLAAKFRRLPISFHWAEYYTWDKDAVTQQLNTIANSSSMLLVAHPQTIDASGQFIAQHSPLVQQRLGDFHLLGAGSYVSIYATKLAYEALSAPVQSIYADYSGRIQISGLKLDGRSMALRVKLLAPLPCKFRLMVHAVGADEVMRPWDQKLDPPLCKWQPGEVRALNYQLPEAYLTVPYRLQIGFFDDADREHGWPPLKLTGGGNYICVPSPDGRVLCPVGF